MATTKKRINRHKLAVIQAYAIIALFVLFGLVAGFIVGRFTAPTKVETVTVTETVEVPTYDSSKLPEVGKSLTTTYLSQTAYRDSYVKYVLMKKFLSLW